MRIEQVNTVARFVANAIVGEIEVAGRFVRTLDLHLWLQRMPLGMSTYPGSVPGRAVDDSDDPSHSHGMRHKRLCQPALATAACLPGGRA